MQSLNFKPQFVDPSDKVGELTLEGERRQRNLKSRNIFLINAALICDSGAGFNLFPDVI